MFAKNSMRVAAAALALSFLALAGGAARAADGDQFVKTWVGSYKNTKGAKVADSTIIIKRSAGGDLTGDWDGYDIASAVVSGNTLTWTCASKAKDPGPNDVNGYYMKATLAGGKLHVEYTAVSGALILLGVISAQPEGKSTEKDEYTGSGDFRK
jgi:hypothetical protein